MSRTRRVVLTGIAAAACVGWAVAPAVAQDSVARTSIGPSAISWQPTVSGYDALSLTVTGPLGVVVEKSFPAGEAASFSPFDLDGTALPDGAYSYELRVVLSVSKQVQDAMRAARESGDRAAEQALAGSLKQIPPQSGSFRVSGGSFVGGAPEAAGSDSDVQTRDIVHLDDVIIDGSLCVGFDCVNGESFGFDTIRLKENNLRIRAVDTSTSASFPSRDWQITFNETSNGGQNKFSIDDIDGGRTPFTLEAGAPSHSLYVDDGGRLGLGTSTPVVDVHVKSGNTPTLRLEQDGTSGFGPQTWDVAGNEANFFIRDATNGSTLPLRIFPSAPNNALTIKGSTGDIGLGTTTPDAELDIEASGPSFRLTNTGTAAGTWEFFMNANTGRMNITDDATNARIPVKIDPGAANNLLQIGVVADDQVDITGNLVVSGTITPDFVFESDYDLESIEEHAVYMWNEKHLPAVAPAQVDDETGRHSVNVGVRSQGVLEELEKAHIYIEQLHEALTQLQARVESLEGSSKQ